MRERKNGKRSIKKKERIKLKKKLRKKRKIKRGKKKKRWKIKERWNIQNNEKKKKEWILGNEWKFLAFYLHLPLIIFQEWTEDGLIYSKLFSGLLTLILVPRILSFVINKYKNYQCCLKDLLIGQTYSDQSFLYIHQRRWKKIRYFLVYQNFDATFYGKNYFSLY